MTVLAPLFALFAFTPAADAATWTLDSSHSKVGFGVTHLMVSTVEGDFREVESTLDFEPGQVKDLTVEVTVQVASVDSGNDKRDEHLRTSDFLDVESHPTMTFVSKKVKADRDGGLVVTGDLTLRGVTKSVTLEGTGLQQVVKDPWGNERVGVRVTGSIDRTEFGVEWNQALEAGGMLVGDEVTLEIQAEYIKQ